MCALLVSGPPMSRQQRIPTREGLLGAALGAFLRAISIVRPLSSPNKENQRCAEPLACGYRARAFTPSADATRHGATRPSARRACPPEPKERQSTCKMKARLCASEFGESPPPAPAQPLRRPFRCQRGDHCRVRAEEEIADCRAPAVSDPALRQRCGRSCSMWQR